MTQVLYFNGLGRGKTRWRERLAMRYLAKRGVAVVHMPVDWYAGEPFDKLLARMVKLAKRQLEEHGELTLVGSSAGGSLAVNIAGELHDPRLSVVTLCSRLHEVPLAWWDHRNLARMAHVGAKNPSQAFYDSVTYCGNATIPKFTAKDKQHIITARQWADFVVPRGTMDIADVRVYKVPGLGHGWGIAMAVRRLPKIMQALQAVGSPDTDRSAQAGDSAV